MSRYDRPETVVRVPPGSFTGELKSGRRWHRPAPAAPAAPEWDSIRTAGRRWSGDTCRTIASPVERDTVSRAVGGLFAGMVRALASAVPRQRPRRR